MNKSTYVNTLLNLASRLDDATQSNGIISQCAIHIIQDSDNRSAIKLCALINKIANSGDISLIPNARDLKNALVQFYGYKQLSAICNPHPTNELEDEKSLEQLLDELNKLIGLQNVKSKVNDLIAFHKVQLLRKQYGLPTSKNTLHLAFTGNPGTGKTTVARIVGRIYKQIGLLSKGHFQEVSRTELIAGYQGQTALKVKKVIEEAKGGVLFIDEAYSITENDHADSYGRECLTELTKALEDYRKDMVVIVAGYTEPMKKFFESNPGLRSRFNTFIEFDDYNSSELMDILKIMCSEEGYILSVPAEKKLQHIFRQAQDSKNNQFSNGRFVRNIFETMITNQARRLTLAFPPTKSQLQELVETDIPVMYEEDSEITLE